MLDLELIVLDRSRVGNQLGNLSTRVTVLRPSLVGSLRHPSRDYRCSNQTLVTIVGTLVRFKVRQCIIVLSDSQTASQTHPPDKSA